MLDFESKAEQEGYAAVAGVDEAGRGPLAGPVVAAAVVLPSGFAPRGLDDSKKLPPARREEFFSIIRENALGYGVGIVSHEVIDEINILQASRLAMKIAVENLQDPADLLLIDGNQHIELDINQWTIVKGDSKSMSIAAASVLAKVTRDRLMDGYHEQYPLYEFKRHKGYGTRLHRDRIKEHGPCPIHRKTFRGVTEFL